MKKRKKIFIAAVTASITGSAIVAVQPAHASIDTKSFWDIQPGSLYDEAIKSLTKQHIVFGYPDGAYRPNNAITRGQAALILTRALQLDKQYVIDPGFQDVNQNSGYFHAIAALFHAGILDGYPDGTFKPEQPLTRAQMAKILAKGYRLPTGEMKDYPFVDVSPAEWYAPYLAPLITTGITVGATQNTYAPKNQVTRGQMALFIFRSQQFMEQPIGIDVDAKVVTIDSDSVQLGSHFYTLTEEQRKWINPSNLPALENAQVKANVKGEKILHIESVTLLTNGRESDDLVNSNKNHVVLNGNGGVIDSTLIVNSDYLSLENVTIQKDLQIQNGVKNRFHLKNVVVKGTTFVSDLKNSQHSSYLAAQNSRPNRIIHLQHSKLKDMEVRESRFTVHLANQSSIEEMRIFEDIHIISDEGIIIPMVKMGSSNVFINAAIDTLILEKEAGSITLGQNARIENIFIPSGIDIKSVIPNYEMMKHAIIHVNGQPNPDISSNGGNNESPPQSDQTKKLQAAKTAVANLFTDENKTALKPGVVQADIDDAQVKVMAVVNENDRLALQEDIDIAQSYLNVQLDAATKLKVAQTAVANLFTDVNKTVLKPGIVQADIDDAQAKVLAVVIENDRLVLQADIDKARDLFNTLALPPSLLGSAPTNSTVTFTFLDDAAWREKITGIYLNGNSVSIHESRVDVNVPGKITINLSGAELSPGTHAFTIKADGYEDVTVNVIVAAPLTPPSLMGEAPINSTVTFTFSDDATWREKITGIYLNGNSAAIHELRVDLKEPGKIMINLLGAELSPGTHAFKIKADGYKDVDVTVEVPAPLIPPALTGIAPTSSTVKFNFSDDAAWRGKISGIYKDGNSVPIHSSRVDVRTPGQITIDLGLNLPQGTYEYKIKADGYEDVDVTVEVLAPLTPPALTGIETTSSTVKLTFSDDAAWRGKISGIYKDGNSIPIHSSRVDALTPGQITINLGNDLPPGTYEFMIKADGYEDVAVTVEIPAPLTPPVLMGSAPTSSTVIVTFSDDAAWRKNITGIYLNGNSVSIHESRVDVNVPGEITINLLEAELSPGNYAFTIKAADYEDVAVNVTVLAP